ncbi:SRPBCC domain-containing protein [Plantibacter flavus]|uniref:SRPBCC domain-containing protein n=1 Tax=Plantibacter flavus TaxID=150123 RepID=UPI003F18191E
MEHMTTNPDATIEEDAFAVRRTIRIDAPLDRVWAAVTEPTLISLWFGEAALQGSGVGAEGTLSWPDHGSIPFRVEAMDAPRSVTYRWCGDDSLDVVPATIDDAHSTVFTFTLEAIEGGTQLHVLETGFETTSDPSANLTSHRDGWTSELDELVALLEGPA